MRGLWKAHHAIQSAVAREDYAAVCEQARAVGVEPRADFDASAHGWRKIDKEINRLRVEIERQGGTCRVPSAGGLDAK